MTLSHSPNIVRDGLVLYLDAGNPKSYPGSGTTWTDLSGNGNNGTLAVDGAQYSENSLGYFIFNGSTDAVSVFNFPPIFSNSVCMCGWFYFNESNTRDILFGSYIVPDSINFEKHTSDRLRLYWNNGEKDIFTGNNVISSGFWQYISIQRNKENQTFDFFVNSILVGQSFVTVSDVTSSRLFRIGRDYRTDPTALNGNISQISVYNKALTEQEIKQNFDALRGRYGI